MTTSTIASRRPAAGANPDKDQHVDNRTADRLLQAVQAGHIYRDYEHEYVDRRNNRNVSVAVYALEDRGFLTLAYSGGITVTDSGEAWLGRDRKPGPKRNTAVTFQPPAVA